MQKKDIFIQGLDEIKKRDTIKGNLVIIVVIVKKCNETTKTNSTLVNTFQLCFGVCNFQSKTRLFLQENLNNSTELLAIMLAMDLMHN